MAILWLHHMFSKLFSGHDAFRGIDKKMFDFDGPKNRIYLPAGRREAAKMNLSPHHGSHIKPYKIIENQNLDEFAETESVPERLGKIMTFLDAMRVGLANGDIFTNKPIDKTEDEVRERMDRFSADHKRYLELHPSQLERIRQIEQRGAETGQEHLIKWFPYLDDPERQSVIDDAIKRNPKVNIVAKKRDLRGTKWESKFAELDPSAQTLRAPGLTPFDPADLPPLPGYSSPSLAGLDNPEGFTRSDPRFTGVLEGLHVPSPSDQRLGQLPPSTATPPLPQVLQFNPETGEPQMFSDGSTLLGPDRYNMPFGPADAAALGGMGIITAAMLGPALAPFMPVLAPTLGLGLAGATAARAGSINSLASGAPATEASASPSNYNLLSPGDINGPPNPHLASAQSTGNLYPRDLASGGTFDDRFGSWSTMPANVVLNQRSGLGEPATPEAASPEEVRRLSRVRGSNAGSAFTSGTAAVPYFGPTGFNDRFGSWSATGAIGGSPQASRPVGTFANEPSYLIPPPIFGSESPGRTHSDADEWFSRWIRPLLQAE